MTYELTVSIGIKTPGRIPGTSLRNEVELFSHGSEDSGWFSLETSQSATLSNKLLK
jgi:hypothetical protein